MTDFADQKQMARKAGFTRRRLAHETGALAGQKAAIHLMQWLEQRQFPVVAGYIPIRTEIDVLPVLRMLHSQKTRICVPVIMAAGKPLGFRQWTPECTMQEGPFGAWVPREGEWLEPDLLLCPLVAFDKRGHRLGYGGGYYDRSLARIRDKKPVTALGFAYAGQETNEVPTESTDQPLDGIVTENGVVEIR